MPYIKSVCIAGKTKEVEKYYTRWIQPKGGSRQQRKKETTERQKKVNDRQTVKRLTRIINANFDNKCLYVTFSYTKEQRPDIETLKKHKKELLKKMRREYRKENKELKYIEEQKSKAIRWKVLSTPETGGRISSIKIVSAVLNGCFQQALRNGLIDRNPVKLAELPRQTERKTRQAMTREQQELFMKHANESYLYNFFAVMLRTGMRNGEMRGLKYTDIDKKNKVIHVCRTLKYIEGQGYIEDTPKTRTSKRDIPLTATTIQLLDNQKNYWGFKVEKMDRYLFCNENGGPLSRERVQAEIERIIGRIRAEGYQFERITPHIFRHTFATRAIEEGMQPQVLKTILGHSSLAMTMDLYSHVLPDTKAEEMEKIASAF